MKKILVALLVVALGIGLAIIVVRSKTNTVLAERLVDDVPVIEISGVLDSAGARKIIRALKQAEARQPAFIVFSFDSPGGELPGTLEVADAINSLSIPTAGFVKEGVSGTIFMIAATDKIYFSPDGVCGAAAPIVMSGGGSEMENMLQKILILTHSKVRSYAKANGSCSVRSNDGSSKCESKPINVTKNCPSSSSASRKSGAKRSL